MAEVPGFGESFSAEVFRSNIKNVMKMGSPSAVVERATFQFAPSDTYSTRVDVSGKPYSLGQQPASTEVKEDVQVDCAVDYVNRYPDGTPIGEFNNTRAKVTILDVDYELVRDAKTILMGGNTFVINYVEEVGLFSVTVYTAHCTARDDS